MCMLYTCGKTTAVATQTCSSKTRLLFRMPIQACEAQDKVTYCADLSDKQKGQMLAQIITYPDRAPPLFEVPEYLLAHPLSAHLQSPPAGTVTTLFSCCAEQFPYFISPRHVDAFICLRLQNLVIVQPFITMFIIIQCALSFYLTVYC